MNPIINWSSIQYERENQLFKQFHEVLEDLRQRYKVISDKSHLQYKAYLEYLGNAIKIDGLPEMTRCLTAINRLLGTELDVSIFLSPSAIPTAKCMPLSATELDKANPKLMVLVSQHFINDLDTPEQLSILGHELGHLLFGHVNIPAGSILEADMDLKETSDLKSNILKWMTCTEISCDLLGLVCSGCNPAAFSTAMIKFTTGLGQAVLHSPGTGNNICQILLDQYNELTQARYPSLITTHPLTPLRLKIINTIADQPFLRGFGQAVDPLVFKQQRNQLMMAIDGLVREIYPELIPSPPRATDGILFMVCIAVALADGHITREHVTAVHKILGSVGDLDQAYAQIAKQLRDTPPEDIISRIINQGARTLLEEKTSHSQIMSMIRRLFVVAASSGKISQPAIGAIANFARPFGIAQHDLAVILHQMKLSMR